MLRDDIRLLNGRLATMAASDSNTCNYLMRIERGLRVTLVFVVITIVAQLAVLVAFGVWIERLGK